MAAREWSEGLAGFTPDQIKRGLAAWDGDWPPSLPEFKKACLGADECWEHRGEAYRPFRRALPAPKAKAEVAAEHLAKMRRKRPLSEDETVEAMEAIGYGLCK